MKIIGHRGGAGFYAENTRAAFLNSIKLGCWGAELDVHLSSDNQVVVHHDAHLNYLMCRREDGLWIKETDRLPIASLDYVDLKKFTVGELNPLSDVTVKFPQLKPQKNQNIPLLSDVINLVKENSKSFKLAIEIKSSVLDAASPTWQPLVDETLNVIENEGFLNRSILCAFDWGALIYAKKQCPTLETWFLTFPNSWLGNEKPPSTDCSPSEPFLMNLRHLWQQENAPWFAGYDPRNYTDSVAEAVLAAGGDAWFLYHADATSECIHLSHALNLDVAAWSVNLTDEIAITKLRKTGVDWFCTDYPYHEGALL